MRLMTALSMDTACNGNRATSIDSASKDDRTVSIDIAREDDSAEIDTVCK